MYRRLMAGISFTIVLLCTILIPTTAEAVTVVRSYELEALSTYTRGSVYFYNRSVEVVGEQNSASGTTALPCRYTKATTNLGSYKYSPVVCQGTGSYDLIIPADVVGGASSVTIEFYATDQTTSQLLRRGVVTRS
jgi:hypothetical protein